MNLVDHIICAFEDAASGKKESALLHACIAVDATSKKLYGGQSSSRKNYKRCLRSYWWILEPMMGVGLNLEDTKFENLKILDGGKPIASPDFADVVYHVFRCNHAHGNEVPIEYQLMPSVPGHYYWQLAEGVLKMPDTVIWALLAVCIFSKANAGVTSGGDLYLTWGPSEIDGKVHRFPLSDWWGKEDEFRAFIEPQNVRRVKLAGLAGPWGRP